ncbi:MAG: TaqI-like C-terminal specificity domain-containing protein, partial [Thermoplasmata archaeon]
QSEKNFGYKISFDFKLFFPKVFREKGGFDVVIANPPYISFGLRGTGKIRKEMENYLRKNYPNSAEYKISIYAIFIDKGIQLLSTNGILSYITPDSFLLGRYFSKLRSFILRTSAIKLILMFEEDFWESGVVGRPVIIILQKELDVEKRRNNFVTSILIKGNKLSEENMSSYSYPQYYFETTPFNRFRLFFNNFDKHFVEKIEKNNITLSSVVSFASGLIGKEGKSKIISKKKLGENWLPGLVSGDEINKYLINYAGNFILFDIKKLKSGFKEANYFEPKLFLRQTGDSLIAAYDTHNLLCLNNLHVVNLKDKKYDLRYILALLNSKLLNYYYRVISLEFGRTLAQIDIDTVELLPIPPLSPQNEPIVEELVSLVSQILSHTQSKNYLSDPQKQAEVKELEKEIDRLVYKLYGLTEAEIKTIEDRM